MRGKKLAAAALAMVIAMSTLFTGCGTPDASTVVASFGDTEITYGVANFYAKYQQAMYDAYYLSYFGEEMWDTDLTGSGSTFWESTKSDIMDSLEQMYRLYAHASDYGVSLTDEQNEAIAAAAQSFMDANSESSLEAIGATDVSIVTEFLTVYTVAQAVDTAIREETEITVTMEDAASKTIRYVRLADVSYTDEDGNTVEYTEDEIASMVESMQAMAEEMRTAAASADATATDASADAESDAFETVAESYGYTAVTYSYAADEDTLDEAVIAAVEAMEEGEISDAIEGDGYIYVVIYDSAYDEEATANYYEELVYNQKADHFTEVYEAMQAESEFTVNESVWKKCKLGKLFTLVSDTTEEETEEASADAASSDAQ